MATLALALLVYAAVSGRLDGTPITAAMVFVAFGLIVGAEALGLVEPRPRRGGRAARRGDAGGRPVRGRRAHRPPRASPRAVGSHPAARHRAAADARRRHCGRRRAVLGPLGSAEALLLAVILAPTDAALGQAVVTLPALPLPHPTGAERRERAERRDLRAALLHRARDRQRGGRNDRRRRRSARGRRGDRLRRRGGCRRGCRGGRRRSGRLGTAAPGTPGSRSSRSRRPRSHTASPRRSAGRASSRRSSAAWCSAGCSMVTARGREPDRGERRRSSAQ